MGKRGPSRKPSAMLRLSNSRKLDHRGDEPTPSLVDTLDVPDCLTAEGKAEWGRVTRRLREVGMLHDIDVPILTAYCALWSEYLKVQALLDGMSKGLVGKGYGGRAEKHPLLDVRNDALKRLLEFSARFGFTPSDRAGLTVSGMTRDEDPMARLMGGKTG